MRFERIVSLYSIQLIYEFELNVFLNLKKKFYAFAYDINFHSYSFASL